MTQTTWKVNFDTPVFIRVFYEKANTYTYTGAWSCREAGTKSSHLVPKILLSSGDLQKLFYRVSFSYLICFKTRVNHYTGLLKSW